MAGKLENYVSRPEVFVVTGPTASGKTSLAIQIAQKLKNLTGKEIEIISADSRQVYKHFPITSAQPSAEELGMFKHHFVNELEIEEEFNAGTFGKQGRGLVQKIFQDNKLPLIVGGSGLYVNSLVYGLFEYDSETEENIYESHENVRKKLYSRLEEKGLENLVEELKKVDPETYRSMVEFTDRRVIRVLEVYHITGIPISEHRKKKIEIGFKPVLLAIEISREELYSRINARSEKMINSGMIEEISALKEKGYHYSTHNSLNTVGAKEVFDYLEGKHSKTAMADLLKQNTRRFAKRQMTWFRKDKNIKWIKSVEEIDVDLIMNTTVLKS
jgi:tRNA dimethylallyltransferase